MWQTYRKSNLRIFMQPSSPEVIVLFPDTKEVVHAAHEHATTRLLSSHLSYLLSAATSIPSPNKPIIIPTAHISITLPPLITPISYNPFNICCCNHHCLHPCMTLPSPTNIHYIFLWLITHILPCRSPHHLAYPLHTRPSILHFTFSHLPTHSHPHTNHVHALLSIILPPLTVQTHFFHIHTCHPFLLNQSVSLHYTHHHVHLLIPIYHHTHNPMHDCTYSYPSLSIRLLYPAAATPSLPLHLSMKSLNPYNLITLHLSWYLWRWKRTTSPHRRCNRLLRNVPTCYKGICFCYFEMGKVERRKRAADSAVPQEFGSATAASQIVGRPPIRPYRRNNLVN